ncbi:hypothetical protein DCAR_0522585 [Daucus carota subsp. sativus]|uniref:Uncharacterized protein n=1 Tax=Daucus carota subsp. sativus TaxID=79200 RepID=A0A164ZW12_DAUCS|nr:PREDICTED: clathrin coat assembly protein AP180-like [Daucus carota subsp. sativus]WOH03190.1 hypothetical protein DCAR_0522585 [Daucus carota subsp. sativus]
MPSKLRKAIEAVKDQTSISIAKVSNNHYTSLEVAVLKATTHDDVPVNERYVKEVLHLISADQIYAAACARAIGKRISRTRNWIVALKSLMLVFRIFQDGDPYFPREVLHSMKKGARILNLSAFHDDSNSSPWEYTAFVRTFASYLEERLDCFLTGKLQRRYTSIDRSREEEDGEKSTNDSIGNMKPSVLLDRIEFWQRLLQRTIATRPTGAATTNRLVQISLYAVVQESFHLYKDILEGLTYLVQCFFHLRYEDCVQAFKTCLKVTGQFAELRQFYTLCKRISVGRDSEYPSVETLSEEKIETLREFLKDQSSFPTVSRSPNSLPNSNQTPQESYERDLESTKPPRRKSSHRASKLGPKQTSLENLLDATKDGTSQGISIDLEAYPDNFKQQSDRNDTFQMSESDSTHSLPITNTMSDLISLEDWSGQEQETVTKKNIEEQRQQTNAPTSWELVLAEAIQLPATQSEPDIRATFNAFPEQEHEEQHTKAGEGWELVLAETATQPMQPSLDPNLLYDKHVHSVSNTLHAFPGQEQNGKEASSRQSWEVVLFETAKQPPQPTPFSLENSCFQTTVLPPFSLDNFNSQPAQLPQHYNPFLEDPNESRGVPIVTGSTTAGFETSFSAKNFSSAPTFQGTPTYSTHNLDMGVGALSAPAFQATQKITGNGMEAVSVPAFQATPTFSAHHRDDGTVASSATFQATPTFSAHNPGDTLSLPTIQATPTFSAHNLDNGAGDLSARTFQATPTFSAHCPDDVTTAYGNDLFAEFTNPGNRSGVVSNNSTMSLASAQMFEGSRNQQNLMHEQQIWLHEPKKFIAKNIA